MIESIETPEDIDKQLGAARTKLQSFEDSVDRKRLLKRLKIASPSHPVLLFRGMFLLLTVLMLVCALAILIIPLFSNELARTIAKFDQIVPVPPEVPALPALLGGLALCMLFGWLMTTLAALAMGRDAQMLPWEQKAHQKLVNEVTRLTTQKAVMARMRNTPAGARPRIDTPVPVSLRDRAGIATPAGVGRAGTSALGKRATPNPAPRMGSAEPGRFGPPGGAQGNNPFGAAPGNKPGAQDSASNPFGPPPGVTPLGAPASTFGGGGTLGGGAGGGGMLARARSGGAPKGLATPAGAAGRIPMGNTSASNGSSSPFGAAPDTGNPFGRPSGGSASNSPFGAAPSNSNPFDKGPSNDSPFGAEPEPAATGNPFGASQASAPAASASASIFGAGPGGAQAATASSGGGLLARARTGGPPPQETNSDFPQIVESSASYSSSEPARTMPLAGPTATKWGRIEDPWLEAALSKAESLAEEFPVQAHLEYSQETHLPFSLVIARATPAIAVRAMISFVEFLASIETPPRARIELKSAANLDRSFHRNVEAALEPYFGDHLEVEAEPGRVEIVFHRPDPSWQDYPILPME